MISERFEDQQNIQVQMTMGTHRSLIHLRYEFHDDTK